MGNSKSMEEPNYNTLDYNLQKLKKRLEKFMLGK
jgi:hypothetical protein